MKNKPPIFTFWTAWSWRHLGARAWTIGIALTLATAGLDWTGHLQPIERWFYNQRALHCQFFTPPPTDRLVHVDIDDSSLETIGRWPWHRTRLAEIIDELRLAGAEALSLDILLADPQEPRAVVKRNGAIEPVDDDANLANAIRRFGKVVTPVSFTVEPRPAPTPQYAAMLEALLGDLELSREAVGGRIAAKFGAASTPPTEDEFLAARRQAMAERLAQSMEHGVRPVEEVRPILLPTGQRQRENSSLLREFNKAYQLAASDAEIKRFALPRSGGVLPPLIAASEELPMILPFATATSYSGYANYIRRPEDP
ncbi:MAG TPA: CHASE2 domain-containing protein, partial [Humisphaera sp.]|nr:CHASE2 domain-containing protein [Humisphaera sp.]